MLLEQPRGRRTTTFLPRQRLSGHTPVRAEHSPLSGSFQPSLQSATPGRHNALTLSSYAVDLFLSSLSSNSGSSTEPHSQRPSLSSFTLVSSEGQPSPFLPGVGWGKAAHKRENPHLHRRGAGCKFTFCQATSPTDEHTERKWLRTVRQRNNDLLFQMSSQFWSWTSSTRLWLLAQFLGPENG